MLKKYFNGLKFGMLLQIAIGPVCLLVFNTAKNNGLIAGFLVVLASALVDSFYITLASVGVSKLLNKREDLQTVFKIVGAIVLILFGVNIILNAFDISIVSSLNLKSSSTNIFIQGLVIALSNPITIVFWGSVLTSKIVKDKLKKKDLLFFAMGSVSATLIFLSSVALIGTFVSNFISNDISNFLNVAVGILIMCFSIKMLIKK